MQVTLNTRISYILAKRLEDYSKATGISKAALVAKALEATFAEFDRIKKEGK